MTLILIDTEINKVKINKNNIIDHLTEVLFIQLPHNFIKKNEQLSGFLSAFKEPRLNNILPLIHKNPKRQWTLNIISNAVGMSRATLQRKFKAGIGIFPCFILHVGEWQKLISD